MKWPCLMMSLALVAGTTAAHAAAIHAPPTCTVLPDDVTIDINGGYSWNGWTSRGFSNQQGVYGGGSTAAVYEIYTTVFTFKKCKHRVDGRAIQMNSDQIPRNFERGRLAGGCDGFTDYNQGDSSLQNASGRPVTNGGAFDDGNIILGIGVRVVNNAQFEAFDTTTASADARRENRWGGWRFFKFGLPASLAVLAAYNEWVPAFEALWEREGRDFPRFYAAVQGLAELPKAERRARLAALAPRQD